TEPRRLPKLVHVLYCFDRVAHSGCFRSSSLATMMGGSLRARSTTPECERLMMFWRWTALTACVLVFGCGAGGVQSTVVTTSEGKVTVSAASGGVAGEASPELKQLIQTSWQQRATPDKA
ncbi:MAG: hypothetical protein AAFX99_33115, partial [Myxococcota bacterium]